MSEIISAVASQIFQQTLENQTQKQQQPTNASVRLKATCRNTGSPAEQQNETDQPIEKTPAQTKTSGVEMQSKLDQMQAGFGAAFRSKSVRSNRKINKMLPELLDSKTRLGMLKEAYSKIGNTSKVTNDLSGRFTQVETEYRQVEAIMRSDKNLSPGELLALQARLYQVSQHIEVMSKVVDQMAGGIKTVLNTNV